MRYYQIAYPDKDGKDVIEVLSEEDIRKEYWPYWYGRMCDKYEQAYVDQNYTFEDCLMDWCIVHWAVEVTND